MGLSAQLVDGRLICIGHDELGREIRSDQSALLILGNDLDRFLSPILDALRLKRSTTIRGSFPKLKSLGEALTHLGVTRLPQSESGWQTLVINIHRFILTRTDRKSSLMTRCSGDWVAVRGFLVSLVDRGLIPVSTYLPPVREALDSLNIAPYLDRLLGQLPSQVVRASASIDKLMCPISLARTDAEYLDELRDTLSSRRHLLKEVLTKHWRHIKTNMEFGKTLLASVDWNELEPLIESHLQGDSYPAYPLNDLDRLANYLAVIHYEYDGCPWSEGDFQEKYRECEFLPKQSALRSIANFAKRLGAPQAPYGSGGWSARNVLWWWQGRISHFDVSLIAALLIMLHPSWTPSAVLFAKVANRHGKQYLDLSDGGPGYEITKHRAKAMKHEILDPLAHEIVATLIEESSLLRQSLLVIGDSKASLLFLPWGKEKIVAPIPSAAPSYISGKTSRYKTGAMTWLGSVYPELVHSGLISGAITFKKIRNTEGVLEWFRTKSLRAVARKLGNTEKVVLQHYIPKAVLDAWNTRMIRRFQNLWISVAAANEEFLVEVTDFGNLAELHAFLRDILQLHGATDSPLAEMLHHRFQLLSDHEYSQNVRGKGHLHVAISTGALSALYSYQAIVIELGLSEQILDRTDTVTGLSPRHFMSLADLLQSQLPVDKNPDYVACHNMAVSLANKSENRAKWAALMA